jgi:choline-sulfatase
VTTAGPRQPNFLFIMADQLAAPALPVYGHKVVKAPHISRLAERGVVFENAYCNSPICAPSRFSMLSGQLATTIGAFDNASEFPASIPTLAHYLSAAGYQTILSGKMHFIGPDQLHGFGERLTTDIYPADFSWTPDWRASPHDKPSGISMQGVIQAGACVRSLQMDYDDEVEFHAVQRLYDLARDTQRKPFFLAASFTHPHPPFTIHREYWDRYREDEIDLPATPHIPVEQRDIQSQWLHVSHGADRQIVTAEHLRNARHAYYGMVSYIDDKVGRLLATLEETGLAENTIAVLCSDHGEMLGERGMWYKQTFFEWSARVPLLIACPARFAPRRAPEIVSLVDLLPTFLDLATDGHPPEPVDPLAGRSLVPLLSRGSNDWPDTAICEYTDMGVCAPCRMIRHGRYKYVYTHGHPAQLYDLQADPVELDDLHGRPEHAAVEAKLRARLLDNWDPEAVFSAIMASQRRRLFLNKVARSSGQATNWSFQAFRDDQKRFVRAAASGTKARARFPFVPPPPEVGGDR